VPICTAGAAAGAGTAPGRVVLTAGAALSGAVAQAAKPAASASARAVRKVFGERWVMNELLVGNRAPQGRSSCRRLLLDDSE
jgi:hypothetical protein